MNRVLTVNAQKCTGCRLCELVCAVSHDGVSNPARSRIKIVKREAEGRYVPTICQQCDNAPCRQACPQAAISRDPDRGYLTIDDDLCLGCRLCVKACPFGAMHYNKTARKVFKCDLCGGDPQCVRFCEEKAVNFVDAERLNEPKRRAAAAPMGAEWNQEAV